MNTVTGISIAKAARLLTAGGVVAIPTETVYGLAGNAYCAKALEKIFAVKQRPHTNPLIVHLAAADQLATIARNIPDAARQLAAAFWPGPLTLVLPKQKTVPQLVTAGQNTVAARVPGHTMALQLLHTTGFPLAAPSANPFNYISPVTAAHVRAQLGGKIPYILNGGRCTRGMESAIVGFIKDKPVLLRPGAITTAALEQCLGHTIPVKKATATPLAPGMFKKHYAPRTPLSLVADLAEITPRHRTGVISLCQKVKGIPRQLQVQLSKNGNMEEAARNLYHALIRLDQLELQHIYVQILPHEGLGITLNDRLRKAAAR